MRTLSIAFLAACCLCVAASVEPTTRPAAVSLVRNGDDFRLSNGILDATIDAADAQVNSILFRGHEMVSRGGAHRGIYFSRDGGAAYENLPHCVASVVVQTPELIELSCKHFFSPQFGDKHAWDVDVHFILRRGDSGLYVFAEVSHPVEYPRLDISEWRMVWSTPEDSQNVLEKIYVDEARHGVAPTPAELARAVPVSGAPKEVTRLSDGAMKDRLDCKYMYAADYWDLGCWGFASDAKQVGAWVVFGGHEFFNDGPFKQDLTVAVGTTLIHLNMNHYNGTPITLEHGQSWRKFYGPWLLYFNHEPTANDCWRDAQRQANLERSNWPYAWVKDDDYPPAKARGEVSGRLLVHDALKPALSAAGAWIGVAHPMNGPHSDFQFQSAGYQFWTHAEADGRFHLPAIRPGNYALYAVVNGAVGEFVKDAVNVSAKQSIDLGELVWQVPHHGSRLAWEIGAPDRRSTEFARGGDFFQPLLYQELWSQVPNPLDFDVATSKPATDWLYAQTRGGTIDHPSLQTWRIHFRLEKVPAGDATLTLAIAGADRANLAIALNENARPLTNFIPENEGGNLLVRETDHGKYSVAYVPIPAALLRAGANTISLTQTNLNESSNVMYDYLSLELP